MSKNSFLNKISRGAAHEKNISTKQHFTQKDSWFPGENGHQKRTLGYQAQKS
jgi:hypothetical protein